MVVTTLSKEAAPLIRYRTRDLTRLIEGECACGVRLPRHDKILGRSDDMVIVRGVNIYPGQVAEVLGRFPELSSEYQIVLTRVDGKDYMAVTVERAEGAPGGGDEALAKAVGQVMHKSLLVSAQIRIVDHGELPRTFAKSRRVLDERQ